MPDSVDCVVIGAGVVGLAVARELAMQGLETVVLESERHIGTATSSRNSEVIHAGIYYPPGSLKAAACIEGRQRLYAYCDEHGVDYSNCGKLIVATSEAQRPGLQSIIDNASACGVQDLRLLDADEARELEPALSCVAAVLSPSTGIIDSHGLMLALQGDVERAGGMLAVESPLVSGKVTADGLLLQVGGDTETELLARHVVNCGGLQAQAIARRIDGLATEHIPPCYYAKGNYYALSGKSPFSRLVYPLPEDGGLGVHLTLDLGGQARFGPDVEWIDEIDYRVDPARCSGFYDEIRKYWPAIRDGSLSPAYAGIRPKLVPQGAVAGDFLLQSASEHGVDGLVNLYGIESPGLTASLALARRVAALITADSTVC